MLSRALCVLHLWTSADISSVKHHLFSCWLLPRRAAITILWILLLCLSFFSLSRDASPPVASMDILNLSTGKFVTSVEFDNVPSSSTLTRLYGCFSFISVVIIKRMMRTGALLGAVWNTDSILVFEQTTVIMEVKPWMEVTLWKSHSMWKVLPVEGY